MSPTLLAKYAREGQSPIEADLDKIRALGVEPIPGNFVHEGDVLRHDPTPVEVAMALTTLSGAGDVGRLQLVQDVVYSPEARAIRVDQGFHTLLNTYPSSAQLAIWVNRLASSAGSGISGNTLIEEIAASTAYFALGWEQGAGFRRKALPGPAQPASDLDRVGE